MPGTTPRLGLPYPQPSENISQGATAIQNLATALDPMVFPGTVTTLPTSPLDGQECFYLADATNGVVWHLKYRATSSSPYKWEGIGGGSRMIGAVVAAENGTATGGYQDLATMGPTVTVPLAGDYEVDFGASFALAAGGATGIIVAAGVFVGATAPSDNTQLATSGSISGSGFTPATARQAVRLNGLASGTVLKLRYNSINSIAFVASARRIAVQPVRVG